MPFHLTLVGDVGRIKSAETQVAIVECKEDDAYAKGILNVFHPFSRLWKKSHSTAGKRPGQCHSDSKHKRQRQPRNRICFIHIGGQQQHRNHNRRNTGSGQQCGNGSHG